MMFLLAFNFQLFRVFVALVWRLDITGEAFEGEFMLIENFEDLQESFRSGGDLEDGESDD